MTTELVDSFFVVDSLNKWKHMKTWKNNISRYSLLYLLTKVCSAQATSVREAPPIAPGFRLLTMLSCPNRAPIPIRVFLYSHQSPHCIPDATSATRLSSLATKVGLFAITSLGKFAFYVSGCFWILCDVECNGVKHALIWRHRMASTARATDCTSCIQTNYIILHMPYCNTMRSLFWSTTEIQEWESPGLKVRNQPPCLRRFDMPTKYLNTKASDLLRFQFPSIHKCIAYYNSSCFHSCRTSVQRTNTCLNPC